MAIFSSQPDEATGLDSWIELYLPTANHATDTLLKVGEHDTYTGAGKPTRFIIDFPGKPTVTAVSAGTLKLYLESEQSANARTLSLYVLKRNWTESGVTWNKYDGSSDWQTAGGTGANDIGGVIGTLALSATEAAGQKTINLDTALLKDWMNGVYYGVLGKMDVENDDYYYFTSSAGTTAGNRPLLDVTYTASSIKKVAGVAVASIKKISGVAIADIKKVSGVG